jgi:hypothetical protein
MREVITKGEFALNIVVEALVAPQKRSLQKESVTQQGNGPVSNRVRLIHRLTVNSTKSSITNWLKINS